MNEWTSQIYIKWDKSIASTGDWTWLKEWPEIKAAWSTTGNWDMTLWVNLATPAEVETFIHTKLREKKWITNTHVVWTKEVWAA